MRHWSMPMALRAGLVAGVVTPRILRSWSLGTMPCSLIGLARPIDRGAGAGGGRGATRTLCVSPDLEAIRARRWPRRAPGSRGGIPRLRPTLSRSASEVRDEFSARAPTARGAHHCSSARRRATRRWGIAATRPSWPHRAHTAVPRSWRRITTPTRSLPRSIAAARQSTASAGATIVAEVVGG